MVFILANIILSQVIPVSAVAVPPPRPLPSPISGPLPWTYTGYNTFPAFYFGSRPEGLQTEETLALIANFSLAGWGWEQGLGARCESCNSWHPTGPLDSLSYCNSEQRLSETATRFRAYLTWGPPSQHQVIKRTMTETLFFVALQCICSPMGLCVAVGLGSEERVVQCCRCFK